MKELEQVLRSYAARYPIMEPADAVKLIYQNEFGGGHMIRDEAACLDYLRREYAAVAPVSGELWESIGNGIIRVHLASLPPQRLEELGRTFIASAAAHTGTLPRFLEKLTVLERLTAEGVFAFDSAALARYLTQYKADGCPAVSHSQSYRAAFSPAYRVVLKSLFPAE